MSDIKNIPTINLKGKEYTEVKDRVMFFRMDEQYRGCYFITEVIELNHEVASFVCKVYNKEGVIISTGTAYERTTQGPVNKTNHAENAETSAVGRALGFLGIGIVGGIATAENMQNTPFTEEWIGEAQRQELAKMIQDSKTDLMKFNDNFSIDSLAELPAKEFEKAKAMLQSKLNKLKAQ